uniref:Uncharacterized protein n=1 Tax=Chenopodium quinoa TaxID=63459 RepID=A0A803LMY4_CHEQI
MYVLHSFRVSSGTVSPGEDNQAGATYRHRWQVDFVGTSQLIYVDLSNNNINGLVENHGSTNISTLKNLRVLKLDDNNLESGHISVSDLTSLRTLTLSDASLNEFSFPLYQGANQLTMSALDLSCNKLTGLIPPELGELEHIHSFNLSYNNLKGPIPGSFSNLKKIESLDFSFNNLSGNIPSQLVELNTLEIFNVSYNNLTGRVPVSRQFGDFDESNYRGNPGLFGFPGSDLHNQTQALPPSSHIKDGDGDHDKTFIEDFLWSFGMSCATIFLATIAILHINPRWRQACFDFVDWYILWWLPMSWRSLY